MSYTTIDATTGKVLEQSEDDYSVVTFVVGDRNRSFSVRNINEDRMALLEEVARHRMELPKAYDWAREIK